MSATGGDSRHEDSGTTSRREIESSSCFLQELGLSFEMATERKVIDQAVVIAFHSTGLCPPVPVMEWEPDT